MVPGDVIEGTLGVSVALEGDNLVADARGRRARRDRSRPRGVSVEYAVLAGDDQVIDRTSRARHAHRRCGWRPAGPGRSAGAPAVAGAMVVIEDVAERDDRRLHRRRDGGFDEDDDTTRRLSTPTTVLDDITVTLTQTRDRRRLRHRSWGASDRAAPAPVGARRPQPVSAALAVTPPPLQTSGQDTARLGVLGSALGAHRWALLLVVVAAGASCWSSCPSALGGTDADGPDGVDGADVLPGRRGRA